MIGSGRSVMRIGFDDLVGIAHFGQIADVGQYVELLEYIVAAVGVVGAYRIDGAAGIVYVTEHNGIRGASGLTSRFGFSVLQRATGFLRFEFGRL